MKIIYLKRVFTSMFYFLKLVFIGKEYDVVFVSSTAFNRGENGENILFKPMFDCCKKNDLSYIVLEDTYFKSYVDYNLSEKSVSFDFILIIQIICRKIYSLIYKKTETLDQVYFRELKISKIIKNLFFKKFSSKVYITLIWNNVTLWRCIDPSACVVDYQHGFIFDGEEEFMKDGRPPRIKLDNNVTALVHGNRYKNVLINNDASGFYSEKNVISVGHNNIIYTREKNLLNNKIILFTLQLTPDFLDKEINNFYVKVVEKLISMNVDFLSFNNYKIIFRHHPRYSKHHCPDINMEYDFVSFDNETPLTTLLNTASLHMTFHSTSAFDASMSRIPTIFIDMHETFSPKEMFLNQYDYPCKDLVIKDYKDFKTILVNIDNKEIFNQCSNDVYQWSKEFYDDFDEKVFQDFLLDQISKYKHLNGDELHQNK